MDPDLPPELAAAVAAERRQAVQTSALHRPAPPTGPRPLRVRHFVQTQMELHGRQYALSYMTVFRSAYGVQDSASHWRQLSGPQEATASASVMQDLPSNGAGPLSEQKAAGTHLATAASEGPSGEWRVLWLLNKDSAGSKSTATVSVLLMPGSKEGLPNTSFQAQSHEKQPWYVIESCITWTDFTACTTMLVRMIF